MSEVAEAEAPDLGLAQVLDAEGKLLEGAELPELSDERLLELYANMVLMRAIDKRLEGLQRMGRIGFFGSARGQEASVIGCGGPLQTQDWVFPALRENGIMLLRGFPLSKYFAHMFGNQHDALKGRMQPMHFAGREVNQVSWSSVIATQMPQAVGAAWAIKHRGDDAVARRAIRRDHRDAGDRARHSDRAAGGAENGRDPGRSRDRLFRGGRSAQLWSGCAGGAGRAGGDRE